MHNNILIKQIEQICAHSILTDQDVQQYIERQRAAFEQNGESPEFLFRNHCECVSRVQVNSSQFK